MAFTGTEMLKADKVLTVGQRMEFFLSNGEEQYSSRIEDILDDKLIVAMPFDSKEELTCSSALMAELSEQTVLMRSKL